MSTNYPLFFCIIYTLENFVFRDDLPLSPPRFVITDGDNLKNPDDKNSRYVYSIKNNYLQDPPIEDNLFNNIEKPYLLVHSFNSDRFILENGYLRTFDSQSQSMEQLKDPGLKSHLHSDGQVHAAVQTFSVNSAVVTNANMFCLNKNRQQEEEPSTSSAAFRDPLRHASDFKSSDDDDKLSNRPTNADIFFSHSNSQCQDPPGTQTESLCDQNPILVNPMLLVEPRNSENAFAVDCAGVTNYSDELEKCLLEVFKDVSKDDIDDTQDIVFNWIDNSFARATNYKTSSLQKPCEMYDVNQVLETVPEDNYVEKSNETSACKTIYIKGSENSPPELAKVSTKTEYLSSGATNSAKHEVMCCCILSLDNWESELCKFLQFSNLNQRFKIKYKGSMNRTVSFKDFCHEELKELVSHGSICIEKLPLNSKKVEKYASVLKGKKTSIVLCKSIMHGLALSEKWDEIRGMTGLEKKTINNKFSNFQRRDRKAGEKLTKEYMDRYGLSNYSSRTDIEQKSSLSIAIFDSLGNLKYLSSKFCKKVVYFFEDEEKIYFVKNLTGFCRAN